jgi:DDE superfamily endonuclease
MDNYGTHKLSKARAWLARHPRYHIHFTPTSGSWLNLVERLFAEVTERCIRRGNHTAVQAASWHPVPKLADLAGQLSSWGPALVLASPLVASAALGLENLEISCGPEASPRRSV